MKIRIILVFLFSIGLFPCLRAGDPNSIRFAGQIIKIGSPKDKVFPRLAADYKLSKIQDSDQWLVSEKEPPHRFVGIILFENEKVSFINKDWGSYYEENIEAFEMLYQALSNISEQGNTRAVLNVAESKEPQGSAKAITLQFAEKRFTISIIKPSGKSKEIVFSEILQNSKN